VHPISPENGWLIIMTFEKTLISAWQQTLVDDKTVIELGGKSSSVKVFCVKNLRNVESGYGKHRIVGIEQNPATKSQWAILAGKGSRIMQVRCGNRYFGNVCEEKVKGYPAWKAQGRSSRLIEGS